MHLGYQYGGVSSAVEHEHRARTIVAAVAARCCCRRRLRRSLPSSFSFFYFFFCNPLLLGRKHPRQRGADWRSFYSWWKQRW